MGNSSLVDYTCYAPCHRKMTGKVNKIITIHHMAGDMSVEACGNEFQHKQGASNYGIDSQGRVGLYVDECNLAFTSNSTDNDSQAITIEVANDGGDPEWHVSDTAMAKLIDLCEDICRRNGIPYLNYTGDLSGNLTMHRWFYNTGCPGRYLASKFPYIANEVNRRLGVDFVIPNVSRYSLGDQVRVMPNGVYYDCIRYPEWLLKYTLYIREVYGKYYLVSTRPTGSTTGLIHEDYLIPVVVAEQPEEPVAPSPAPVRNQAKVTILEEREGFARIDGGGWVELSKMEKI